MATRVFLVLSALIWIPYGIFCFVQPAFLAEAAGVSAVSVTGMIEIQAMYGGLQIAIGSLALLALFRGSFRFAALVALGFLCSGLGLSRGVAALGAAELSTYTAFGLAFEGASALAAFGLLLRERPAESAQNAA